jgi:5-methylcytosine-specific restriction endonuclease McrA
MIDPARLVVMNSSVQARAGALNTSPTELSLRGTHMKRKSIPKSIRFEVLKRDSFKCQYCGRSAPEVLLQVDHMEPVAKGGSDEVVNLITSCFDCNSGKSDRRINDQSVLEKQKLQIDELQERREQLEMMLAWRNGLQDLAAETVDRLAAYWNEKTITFHLTDQGRAQLRKIIGKYQVSEIAEAMDTASDKYLEFHNGLPTHTSVNFAWSMVPKIIETTRECARKPELKDLLTCRAILRRRLEGRYFDGPTALKWLDAAYSWGISIDTLRSVVFETRSWSKFSEEISALIRIQKERDGQ